VGLSETTERRFSAAIVFAACAVFTLMLLVLPSYFPTFDEAKYLGIGVDIWSGKGITTVFGIPFIVHAPAWPAVIQAPQALLGISALSVGRVLNAISGISMVAFTGVLGWRIRPIIGAMAASGILALVYLHDLSRTARLDVPAGALLMAFLVIALVAVQRGSLRWAIAAGVVFALGFLVKEIDLPFAPAPWFVGAVLGRPWRSLWRTGAAFLGISAIGVAPWFAYYAAQTQHVYRLEAPLWAFVPIVAGLIVLIAIGVFVDRIANGPLGVRVERLVARLGPEGRTRAIVGWGLTLLWAGLMTYAFAKTSRLTSAEFLGIDQVRLYVDEWFGALRGVAVFGLVGVGIAVASLFIDRSAPTGPGIKSLLIVTITGIPLILLVISVGEPPRNYLANLAIVTALAAAGWSWAVDRILRSTHAYVTVGGLVALGAAGGLVLAGLTSRGPLLPTLVGAGIGATAAVLLLLAARRDRPLWSFVGPGVAVALLIGGSGLLVAHGRNTTDPPGDAGRSEIVSRSVAWIRANIPPGSTIAYGEFLAYETAYNLATDYGTVQIRARLSTSDVAAPDGMARTGEAPADDWVAIDIAPRNVYQFYAYRAHWLIASFARTNATYWVYTTGISTSSPTIEAALTTATGFQKLAEWSVNVPGFAPYHTSIYKVDPTKVVFDTSRLVVAPDALDRLVDLMAKGGADGKALAARLVDQVDVQPPGPDADAALARLKAAAGR
jgi:Dolichyl-phosphate-mannose-protein mannosyltransferase